MWLRHILRCDMGLAVTQIYIKKWLGILTWNVWGILVVLVHELCLLCCELWIPPRTPEGRWVLHLYHHDLRQHQGRSQPLSELMSLSHPAHSRPDILLVTEWVYITHSITIHVYTTSSLSTTNLQVLLFSDSSYERRSSKIRERGWEGGRLCSIVGRLIMLKTIDLTHCVKSVEALAQCNRTIILMPCQ